MVNLAPLTGRSGRVLVDLAVAVADGAECSSDIAVLVDQPGPSGPVAPDSTVWRLLDRLEPPELTSIAAARAASLEELSEAPAA